MRPEDHVAIAETMVKSSKTPTDVLYLLISLGAGKGRLMDIKGNDVVSYGDFVRKSKARLIAMFVIYIDHVSHVLVTLHDMKFKKRIMVFDNLGETPHVTFVSELLRKEMKRPDLFLENMSSCPVRKISGFDCAYWTLAFFKYMLDHPTGSITGFQQRFSRKLYNADTIHTNHLLQTKMKTHKKHINRVEPSNIEALFLKKLTLN